MQIPGVVGIAESVVVVDTVVDEAVSEEPGEEAEVEDEVDVDVGAFDMVFRGAEVEAPVFIEVVVDGFVDKTEGDGACGLDVGRDVVEDGGGAEAADRGGEEFPTPVIATTAIAMTPTNASIADPIAM